MKCPTCHDNEMQPQRLDNDLPAYGCTQCDGSLISLLYYRDWAERYHNVELEEDEKFNVDEINVADDTRTSVNCPKCKRIMIKYHITGTTKNRLDLCSFCDEAWLDGGEWELLKALQLSKKLPLIFTKAWQIKAKKKAKELKFQQRYSQVLGDEFEKAEEVRRWLSENDKRAEILFYISQQ